MQHVGFKKEKVTRKFTWIIKNYDFIPFTPLKTQFGEVTKLNDTICMFSS